MELDLTDIVDKLFGAIAGLKEWRDRTEAMRFRVRRLRTEQKAAVLQTVIQHAPEQVLAILILALSVKNKNTESLLGVFEHAVAEMEAQSGTQRS